MANLDALMTSARTNEPERDLWETPKWLFELLDSEFGFDLDVAATEDNSLCNSYFDIEVNALTQEWWGNCFCNCPYSQAKYWYQKAWSEATLGHATTVMLVPARTDTQYWWTYATKGEIRFLPGRLKFGGNNGRYSAPFPSAICIFHKDIQIRKPKVVFWDMREGK